MSSRPAGQPSIAQSMEGKRIIPDEQTVAGALEEIEVSTADERDELLTDLLCHVYGTLASQNG